MGTPKRQLIPDEFDEPVADEFDEPEVAGDTDDPDEPISNMQVGEPTAIIGGVEQEPADAGFVRQVANPERDRANEMAKTLASMGSNDAAGIYEQWAARGEPLESDRRYFSPNRSVGAGGRVAGSPLSAPAEADTIGRTLRDAGVAGAQGAWQGFADNIVGGVENLKDTLGTERYGYPADLDKAQRVRDRVALAHQRSPKSSFVANAVGAAAPFIVAGVPTTPGGMIATGAGQGALSGYGHADPKTLEDAAWSVLGGASAGASATLPFAAAGPVGSYVGGKMVEAAPWVETQAGRANMRHALGKDFEAIAEQRGGIEGIDELAAFAHAEGLDKGWPASQRTWQKRAEQGLDQTQATRQGIADQATARGVEGNTRQIIDDLNAKADAVGRDLPAQSQTLSNKYRAQADRINELTKRPEEFYEFDVDLPGDKVYMSTPRLDPAQFKAGQLEGVGGVGKTGAIGDEFVNDYMIELPRNIEGKPQVADIDYSGPNAGRAAMADNMRVMRRVEGSRMENDPALAASQVYERARKTLPEGAQPYVERYGFPKVERANSPEDLTDALLGHFEEAAKKERAQQAIDLKDAEIKARALGDSRAKTEALEGVASQKRVARVERMQGEVDPRQRAIDLAEAEIQARKITDPKARMAKLAEISEQKQLARVESMKRKQGPANKAIELEEAGIQARRVDEPKTRRQALGELASQKRQAELDAMRQTQDLETLRSAESRAKLTAALEERAKRNVAGYAQIDDEAMPIARANPEDVRGSLQIPQRGTRIFTRDPSLQIEGYRTQPFTGTAAETAANAPPELYGPYTGMAESDTMPFAQMLEQRGKFDDALYGAEVSADEGMQGEVTRYAGNKFREGLVNSLRDQAPDLLPMWQSNQARAHDLLSIAKPAKALALRGDARPPVGLPEVIGGSGGMLGTAMALARKMRPDATLGKVGYGTAGALRSVGSRLQNPSSPISAGLGETAAEAAGARVGRGFAAPAYAEAKQPSDDARGHLSANAARKLLQTNPQALGPYAAQWQQALDKNDPAAVSALMQRLERDNSYKRTVKRALEQQTAAIR